MKDAHCAEPNEKSNFRIWRILFFESWVIVFTIFKCVASISKCVGPNILLPFKSDQIYRNGPCPK